MKKIYYLIVVLFALGSAKAQVATIPDANFKAKLLAASPLNTTAKNLAGNYFAIDANNNGEIELSEALQVSYLDVSETSLLIASMLGISNFTNLEYLNCNSQNLSSLDVSALVNLESLNCNSNEISTINVVGLSNLKFLYAAGNQIGSVNVTALINLEVLSLVGSYISALDLSGLINLQKLYVGYNELFTLDLTNQSNLTYLDCGWNYITNLNLPAQNVLETLRCHSNYITTLNLSNLTNLKELWCNYNYEMGSLNLSASPLLESVVANDCQLTSINVAGLANLESLWAGNNQLSTIDVTGLSSLSTFDLPANLFQSLDLSSLPSLEVINVSNNTLLNNLNIKNGNPDLELTLGNNPNLVYVCADEYNFPVVLQQLANVSQNCELNTYCSFEPGGTYYTIQGSNTLDANNNGCDANDLVVPNLKMNITNSDNALTGVLVANTSGQYNLPIQAGTHILTPVLENPNYFAFSPTSATVTFPAPTSPFTQNFCVTPNGFHQDLDVTIIPMDAAIPGFDSHYKIIYRNIGNVNIAMGSMAFDYDDATLDYVSSTPTTEVLPLGNLFWTFLNLQPFETRTIDVVFNLNSPTETPALNSGSMLSFSAYVATSVGEDTNPIDNLTTLQQLVVNSFDPNDKTCLEGTSITPDMIGKYVHYMIRFENTGTFPAQNIVVKDMIDATKFDVTSLIPLNASHDYVTRITGNKVEFIFENINLPFDDAMNDGYIVFKIKTLPTLALGDTFSNSASIYFDYNFPIVTDPAVTTFATLATQDFVFNNYLTVYPNPTNDVLNLTAKQAIELQSMAVYNVVGQLVLSVPNAKGVSTIDVSNLTTGTYFLKVVSDKGTSNVKFMKK